MNPKLKKALLVIVATAPIGLALLAFGFMVQSELAFDESTCPYVEREVREVAPGVHVREDARTCQEGVEEHRWVVLRDGVDERTIGQRRLQASLYEDYSWAATIRDGQVRLEITDGGSQEFPRVFNERLPDAGTN